LSGPHRAQRTGDVLDGPDWESSRSLASFLGPLWGRGGWRPRFGACVSVPLHLFRCRLGRLRGHGPLCRGRGRLLLFVRFASPWLWFCLRRCLEVVGSSQGFHPGLFLSSVPLFSIGEGIVASRQCFKPCEGELREPLVAVRSLGRVLGGGLSCFLLPCRPLRCCLLCSGAGAFCL
jgi:hypothetical protein